LPPLKRKRLLWLLSQLLERQLKTLQAQGQVQGQLHSGEDGDEFVTTSR
jgi:hypothetical protein